MSEDKCPKCGAEWTHLCQAANLRSYACKSGDTYGGGFYTSYECYDRQLAQAKARIAELEAWSVEQLPEGGWLSFEDGMWSAQLSDNDPWHDGDSPASAISAARAALAETGGTEG